ncbi:MAG: c-type cytochrome [Casimicrobiaceae bacterium]
MNAPETRLNPHLEASLTRIRLAGEQAAERCAEGLGLSALSAGQIKRRDALLAAQFVFGQQQAVFLQRFLMSLRKHVIAEQSETKPAAAPAATAVAAKPRSGEEVYQLACAACHGAGVAGAPKTGDKVAWAPRIAQGVATLYKHSIEGYKGMPARGGNSSLTDDEVKAAVDYQVAKAK